MLIDVVPRLTQRVAAYDANRDGAQKCHSFHAYGYNPTVRDPLASVSRRQ